MVEKINSDGQPKKSNGGGMAACPVLVLRAQVGRDHGPGHLSSTRDLEGSNLSRSGKKAQEKKDDDVLRTTH